MSEVDNVLDVNLTEISLAFVLAPLVLRRYLSAVAVRRTASTYIEHDPTFSQVAVVKALLLPGEARLASQAEALAMIC